MTVPAGFPEACLRDRTSQTEIQDTAAIEQPMKPIVAPGVVAAAADLPPRADGGKSRSACLAAVDSERDRIAACLTNGVIHDMFGVGLRLQATALLTNGDVQTRIELAVRDLDRIIVEVRSVIFDRLHPSHEPTDRCTPP